MTQADDDFIKKDEESFCFVTYAFHWHEKILPDMKNILSYAQIPY